MEFFSSAETGQWLSKKLKGTSDLTLWLVSPFITSRGLEPVHVALRNEKRKLSLRVVTKLDPLAVSMGFLDAEGLRDLCKDPRVIVYDCPNLHAKVFLAEGKDAVLGSSNLTGAGLGINQELGVRVSSKQDACALLGRVEGWRDLSRRVHQADIDGIIEEAKKFEDAVRKLEGLRRLPALVSDEGTYLDQIIMLAKRVSRRQRTRETFLKELCDPRRPIEDELKAAERRLQLLLNLKIVEQQDDKIVAGSRKPSELEGQRGKDLLFDCLRDIYPEFDLVLSVVKEREMTSEDLEHAVAHALPKGRPEGKSERSNRGDNLMTGVENAKRWLVFLGRLEVTEGTESQIRKFRAKKERKPRANQI